MSFLCTTNPQKTAISTPEGAHSFCLLSEKIQDMAKGFKQLPQAILILEARPTLNFIIQLLAALSIDQPVALFSSQWSLDEKKAKETLLGSHMRVNEQGALIHLNPHRGLKHHPQLALILFTSGTTGQVKAVQLSRVNILANTKAIIKAFNLTHLHDQLLFLPLSYSFGLLGQLLPALMAGITTDLLSEFMQVKTRFENAQIPQMWSGVPSHWMVMSKMAIAYPESAAKIKAVVSAGAPLPVSLRQELKQRFPQATLYNNYGLTEASPRILTYSSKDSHFMEDYAGYPIGDWQIKLSADQELLIQGSQLMLGYLGDNAQSHLTATQLQNGQQHHKTIQAPPSPYTRDEGGDLEGKWFSTGDLAQILPCGLVAIKGRRDNLVNVGGIKTNLNEIEQKITQIEGLNEVIVLPLTDSLYGVRLLVCINENTLVPGLTEQVLSEKIRHHLLPDKLPITVQFVGQIPRNQHGKPDRNRLLQQLTERKNQC